MLIFEIHSIIFIFVQSEKGTVFINQQKIYIKMIFYFIFVNRSFFFKRKQTKKKNSEEILLAYHKKHILQKEQRIITYPHTNKIYYELYTNKIHVSMWYRLIK